MTILFVFFLVSNTETHTFATHLTVTPVNAKSESVKNIGMHNKDISHG